MFVTWKRLPGYEIMPEILCIKRRLIKVCTGCANWVKKMLLCCRYRHLFKHTKAIEDHRSFTQYCLLAIYTCMCAIPPRGLAESPWLDREQGPALRI